MYPSFNRVPLSVVYSVEPSNYMATQVTNKVI